MSMWEWRWQAFCSRVVDGDTLDLMIDKGFHDLGVQRIRLAGINCPEVHGLTKAAGDTATMFTDLWIDGARAHAPDCMAVVNGVSFNWPLTIVTHKTDSFDRWVAVVTRTGDPVSLNDALLASGNAVPFMVERSNPQGVTDA